MSRQDALFREDTGEAEQSSLTLALFYHDAIYDPSSRENEAASAGLAMRELQHVLPPETLAEIERLILITDHARPAAAHDERLITDVDLSILGRSADAFDRYDAAIRAEYAHVPEEAYRTGRGEVLRQFLDRPRIYGTEWFFRRYEETARENLARALARLTGR